MTSNNIREKTVALLDELKATCQSAGLGNDGKRVCRVLGADCPNLFSRHLITQLWNQQTKGDFDVIFDSTMKDIAAENMEIFSTLTVANTKIPIWPDFL